MKERQRLTVISTLAVLVLAAGVCTSKGVTTIVPPEPWRMFHRDERHSGLSRLKGRMTKTHVEEGPPRWKALITPPGAGTEQDLTAYRWFSNFALGDVDGDGTLEVVVPSAGREHAQNSIYILKDRPGTTKPAPGSMGDVELVWKFDVPTLPGERFIVDQYGPALADIDGDNKLDILFTTSSGKLYALSVSGRRVLWTANLTRPTESGPMVADIDPVNDGPEVIITTACTGNAEAPCSAGEALLQVYRLQSPGQGPENVPIPEWTRPLPAKADSGEPVVLTLRDRQDGVAVKALGIATWARSLVVIYRDPLRHAFIEEEMDLTLLANRDDQVGGRYESVARTSPMAIPDGDGTLVAFGWMTNKASLTSDSARISMARVTLDGRKIRFEKKWTIPRLDWKSSPAHLPIGQQNWIVTGYGIGSFKNTGDWGYCAKENDSNDKAVGGVIAIDESGVIKWEHDFQSDKWKRQWPNNGVEGNVRGSPVVMDVDGNGSLDVVIAEGCQGALYAFDGATGHVIWRKPLGPRTMGTPSIGDLDGDGRVELVIGSYDGYVWALGRREMKIVTDGPISLP